MAMNKQRSTSNLFNILNYDAAGNIVLKDYSQTIRYNWNGTIHAFTGPLSISSITAATTDTDKFIVSDGGVLKYRTGADVLSDIGAQAAGSYVPTARTLTINGTSYDLSADRSWTISSANIYTADGTLTGNRTVNLGGYSLDFKQGVQSGLKIDTNNDVLINKDTGTAKVYRGLTVSPNGNTGYNASNTSMFVGDGTNFAFIGYNYLTGARAVFGGITSAGNQLNIALYGRDLEIYNAGTVGFKMFDATSNIVLQRGGTFVDSGYRLDVNGTARVSGNLTASSFIKSGGTSSQYLMADGSISTLSNPVTGTGTTNNLPKWTSSTALGNSIIDDDGTSASVALATGGAFNIKYLSAIKLAFTGGTGFGSIDVPVGLDFLIRPDSVTKFKLTSTGKLLLGSTTDSGDFTLQVTGNASFSANIKAAYYGFPDINGYTTGMKSPAAETISFQAGGNEYVRITSVGNFLIGSTTDAGYKLDVNGTGRFLGSVGVKTVAPYEPATFSLDVNGGLLVKNTTGTTAQITIINADPSLGGNNAFVQQTVGGTSGTSYVSIQGYYGTSVAGSTPIRLNPSGGNVLIGTTTNNGSALQVSGDASISGVFRETVTTNRQSASYSLALTDNGKLVEMNVASANNLTVPLNSSITFPVGTKIDISQYGAGQTTVVATGGVNVRSAGGALKLAAQYSGATLVKIGTDEWYLFGDITV